MLFWNKKVTQEELESHRSYVSQRHHLAVGEINLRVESLEVKLDLILSHLKLKYVPETETKEPAKLVEVEEIEKVYLGFPLGYVDRPISKKGRPKKK